MIFVAVISIQQAVAGTVRKVEVVDAALVYQKLAAAHVVHVGWNEIANS